MSVKDRRLGVIIGVTVISSLFFLLLRAPYGWCFNDEPFIVTLAQRLYMGDRMILDEWHPAQVFGPVILPFYAVFRLFSSDNTGILLAFRYVYSILWWSTCLIVSHSIRKSTQSATAAFCIFVYLVLFSPLDYMTISYTSMGLMSCLLLSCIILEAQNMSQRSAPVFPVIISVCVTILVLCSPYMAVAFILILIIAVGKLNKTESLWEQNCLHFIRWSGFFSILFLAVIAIGLGSKKGENWKTYIECIQMVLADPAHPNTSIIKRLIKCLLELVNKNWMYSALIGVSIGCSFYRKGLKRFRPALFLICVCGYLYAVYSYLCDNVYVKFNQQMIDIALLGLVAFALLEEKPWELFLSFTVTGLIYTFMNYLASNTGIYSIGMTMSVCGVGSIVYIVKLCQELRRQYPGKKRLRFLISLICVGIMVTQLSSELLTRVFRQYWDEEPAALTETIQVGAAKGLKTTLERKEEYELQYEELKTLLNCVTEKEENRFVCITASPVTYLDADMRFGTFSAWSFSYQDNYMDYLIKYEMITHHSEERVFYISRQDDLPDSFPIEHYQMLKAGNSALFVPSDIF